VKKIISILAFSTMLPTASICIAAEPLSNGSFKVAVAGSCLAYFARCNVRCNSAESGHPDGCRRKHCDTKLAICQQSGCWEQDEKWGGAVTCGLAK
jgi:hypothetical protein